MNLDRGLIKSQAKELMKGKVFKLFIIIFIVTALFSGGSLITSVVTTVKSVGNAAQNAPAVPDIDSYGSGKEFDLDKFMDEYSNSAPSTNPKSVVSYSFGSSLGGIVSLIMMPLAVTMAGLFLLLVRGEDKTIGEGLAYIFKNAFDKNYFNRFLLVLLQGIFTFLWSLLFIIPGIVYMFKIFFAVYIVAENPEINWRDALNLSKKMTAGHKGELFVLELSFIPWYLLTGITFGIASIYVLPYIETVHALYYQNFKARAIQEGTVLPMEFYSAEQRVAMAQPTPQPPYGAAPNAQPVMPQQPVQNVYQPVQPQQNNYYQQPAQPVQPVQPAAPVAPVAFEQPVQPAAPTAPTEDAAPVIPEPTPVAFEAPVMPEAPVEEAPAMPEEAAMPTEADAPAEDTQF